MKIFISISSMMVLAHTSPAAIVAYSSNFDVDAAGWTSIGTTPTNVARVVSSNDGNLAGDLVTGDGALRLDTVNATVGDEAMGFTVGGTMDAGRLVILDYGYFNGNVSFINAQMELFNLTDGTSLASETFLAIGSAPAADDQLTYNTLASDVGDVLQIRITELADNTARNIWVDNISVSSVPEPSSLSLLGLSFATLLIRRKR